MKDCKARERRIAKILGCVRVLISGRQRVATPVIEHQAAGKHTGGVELLAQCNRIKANGERCRARAMPGSEWCYNHDPAHSEKRRQSASKGGKRGGRGRNKDLKDVKEWLLRLAADVEEGRLQAKDGAVVSQILNVFFRGVEVERRIKESEELEERLEALEGVLKGRKAG